MEANNTRQDALELTDSDEKNESHSDELRVKKRTERDVSERV